MDLICKRFEQTWNGTTYDDRLAHPPIARKQPLLLRKTRSNVMRTTRPESLWPTRVHEYNRFTLGSVADWRTSSILLETPGNLLGRKRIQLDHNWQQRRITLVSRLLICPNDRWLHDPRWSTAAYCDYVVALNARWSVDTKLMRRSFAKDAVIIDSLAGWKSVGKETNHPSRNRRFRVAHESIRTFRRHVHISCVLCYTNILVRSNITYVEITRLFCTIYIYIYISHYRSIETVNYSL